MGRKKKSDTIVKAVPLPESDTNMKDTWNPADLNEESKTKDTWNPAVLNEELKRFDSWNPAEINQYLNNKYNLEAVHDANIDGGIASFVTLESSTVQEIDYSIDQETGSSYQMILQSSTFPPAQNHDPYVYRPIPSDATGKTKEMITKITGASVVWNQLVDANTTSVTITSGHKYIHWNGSTLTKATSDGTAISVTGGTDKIYDISAMFGNDTAAIAITTARFAELFPDYTSYAYSANTIQSVSVSWHKVVGKNKLPMTLDGIKAANTSGSWNGNVYSVSSAIFTVITDDGGNVESIRVNGTPSTTVSLFFPEAILTDGTAYKLNGCPSGGSISTYALMHQANSNIIDSGNGIEFVKASTDNGIFRIRIQSGYTCNNLLFKPMIRLSTETDATYKPYTEETTTLDHTTLRGLFKLDANNNLYADGDIYNADGSEDVKYEERAYASGDESLPDTITDGTTTVTKKVTPTTATLTPFNPLSTIEKGGTEEFIDYGVQESDRDVSIPVAASEFYFENATVVTVPDPPETLTSATVSIDNEGVVTITDTSGEEPVTYTTSITMPDTLLGDNYMIVAPGEITGVKYTRIQPKIRRTNK